MNPFTQHDPFRRRRRRSTLRGLAALAALLVAVASAGPASKPDPIMVATVEPAADESSAFRLVIASAVDLPEVWVEVTLRPPSGARFIGSAPPPGMAPTWHVDREHLDQRRRRWSGLRLERVEPSPTDSNDPESRPFALRLDVPPTQPISYRTPPRAANGNASPRPSRPHVVIQFGAGTPEALQAGGRLDLTFDNEAGQYVAREAAPPTAATMPSGEESTAHLSVLPSGRRRLSPALTRVERPISVADGETSPTVSVDLAEPPDAASAAPIAP